LKFDWGYFCGNVHPMTAIVPKLCRFPLPFFRRASTLGIAGVALTMLLTLFMPHMTEAEEESEAVEALNSMERLAKSIESSLPSQRAELANLRDQLQQLETLQNAVQDEINAYDSQNTFHSQLLLASRLRIEELENAIKDNRMASKSLTEKVGAFQKHLESAAMISRKTAERIELARKQLVGIRQSQLSDDQKQQLEDATQKLLQVLEQKRALGERLSKIYEGMLGRATSSLEAKKAIGEKMASQLESQKKASLIQRMVPYRDLSGKALLEELRFFQNRIATFFSIAKWKTVWEQVKLGEFAPWAFFLAALAVIIALRNRYRSMLKRIEARCEGTQHYFRWLCLFLLRRSLPYLGLTLLFGFYSSIQFSLVNIQLGRFLFYIFLVLLVTRWGLDYLKRGFRGQPTGLRSFVAGHLKHFIRFYRSALLVVITLLWIAGRDSSLVWMVRTVVSAGFLGWAVVFWRRLKPVVVEGVRNGQPAPDPKRMTLLMGWTYLVCAGTLLLNLSGYSVLAGYWFGSWSESVALLFWGWMSLNALREWRRDFQAEAAAADVNDKPLTSGHHWRWSLIQLARAGWFVGLATAIVWVWDPSGFLWLQIRRFFGFTIAIGSLNLSIWGIGLAVVIILATQLVLRVGRSLLKEKILDKRMLDRGLKDSILTITSYLGWGLGLILALSILGVNTTSLAVIFGALSIGIGFGLQNIFNNFISGLILLFERPIQVGDYVEVGGLWAEVKKINVRSTVVQTFDNASVIIPNSEFISQQVTNWSFKDKRMRRNLDIGVAYGSDVALVQETLLEIACETPGVLKYPRPDVIFVDHADSALIFRLRIWVDVDDYWTVASRIRCDIDRRFRELAIEIAFPQRDLHIRTLPKEIVPAAVAPEGLGEVPSESPRDS